MVKLSELINNSVEGRVVDSFTNEEYKRRAKEDDKEIKEILKSYDKAWEDAGNVWVR